MDITTFIENFKSDRKPGSEEDAQFYVPIYENELSRLRKNFLYDSSRNKCVGIKGQTGTGKSTALSNFPDGELRKKYEILHLNLEEYLELGDVHIEDVLLMIGFMLAEKSDDLRSTYIDKLGKLKEIQDGTRTEENQEVKANYLNSEVGGGLSIGGKFLEFLKLGGDFFMDYKHQEERRKIVREFVRPRKKQLFEMLNGMITQYLKAKNLDKQLLLILDGLEKCRNQESIQRLFQSEDNTYLFDLECPKIITLPISASTYPEVTAKLPPITHFILLTQDSAEKNAAQEEMVKAHKKQLKKLCLRRCNDEDVVDDDALELAIQKSGGVIRQFLGILREAAYSANRNKFRLTKNDVEDGLKHIKLTMDGSIISGEIIEQLEAVRTEKYPGNGESDVFVRLLQTNLILGYGNGTAWYDVNPIIEETVKTYARRKNRLNG